MMTYLTLEKNILLQIIAVQNKKPPKTGSNTLGASNYFSALC
jgi:hypothetical protein